MTIQCDARAQVVAEAIKALPEFQAGHLDVADMKPLIAAAIAEAYVDGYQDGCEEMVADMTKMLRSVGV